MCRPVYVLVGVLVARPAASQCVLEGSPTLTVTPDGASAPVVISEPLRATLRGASAVIEGTDPIAFRATLPASGLALYLARPVTTPMLGAAAGVQVAAQNASSSRVVVDLRAGERLGVRGVAVPCGALTLRVPAAQPAEAPLAPFVEHAGWMTHATARERTDCRRTVGGMLVCAQVRNRCAPVGDGSVCGYHPVAATLRVFASPSTRAASLTLTASRDVTLADEHGRGAWLLVRTRTDDPSPLALRGWVRASEVRWSQEVPPSSRLGLGTLGSIGRAQPAVGRRGFVVVEAGAPLEDPHATRWGTVVRAWCTAAEQAPDSSRVRVTLPGASESAAFVAGERVRWVDACEDEGH
jgi:hypothetical protein